MGLAPEARGELKMKEIKIEEMENFELLDMVWSGQFRIDTKTHEWMLVSDDRFFRLPVGIEPEHIELLASWQNERLSKWLRGE